MPASNACHMQAGILAELGFSAMLDGKGLRILDSKAWVGHSLFATALAGLRWYSGRFRHRHETKNCQVHTEAARA